MFLLKKISYGFLCTCLFLFLLLKPSLALSASMFGLRLWFDTLIPTLFPFMVLSGFLIQSNLIYPLVSLISPFMRGFLNLSPGGTYALLMGFLCGYPMGAKVISDLTLSGQISHCEAAYLLGFCNNISPAFIITFLVTQQLKAPALMLPSLFILYGSPITYGLLQNISYRKNHSLKEDSDFFRPKTIPALSPSFSMIDSCILNSATTIVKLGGYIILFALLSGIVQILPLPAAAKALTAAVLEITTGIPALLETFPQKTAYLFLMISISFGGLSALAQTNSVIKSAHLSLWKYVRSKIIISIFSFAYALIFLTW